MDLSFYPLTLDAIDQAQAESLCLFVGEDERPLRGLAGLVDWRLAGGLSKYLRNGFVTGRQGDALLTAPGPRLGFQKLFIFGMGPSGQTEEELAARLAEGLRKLAAAGVRGAAFDLPAGLSVEVGVRTLVDEREGPPKALVFGADPAALVTALAHAATRGPDAPTIERRVIKVPGPARPTPLGVAPVQPSQTAAMIQPPQTSATMQPPPQGPKPSPTLQPPQTTKPAPTVQQTQTSKPAPTVQPSPTSPPASQPLGTAPQAAPATQTNPTNPAVPRPPPPAPQRYVPPPPKPTDPNRPGKKKRR